ncbi:MAG: hypothetical protein QXP59_06450 [Saccharolobus sp.]
MILNRDYRKMSSYNAVQQRKETTSVHPFTHQPIGTTGKTISHIQLNQPTRLETLPAHPVGMPNFDWYKQNKSGIMQNQSILRSTGLTQLNPFKKILGGLENIGPVGGNASLTKTPENTLPFHWHGYMTPTLPTKPKTETPIPKKLPLKWEGVGMVKPPNEGVKKSTTTPTTKTTWHPTLRIVSSTINPFTKGSHNIGGIGGIGPVSGTTTLKTAPENTLPFHWTGISTPTLPPTEKTTVPVWHPIHGVPTLPPTEKTTVPVWHPIHGVPTLPPTEPTEPTEPTQPTEPTEPTQPQENPNATYGVLGSIALMLLPFIL